MHLRRLFGFMAVVLGTLFLGGCGTMHMWGAKNGGNPASFGSSLDIPLGGGGGR